MNHICTIYQISTTIDTNIEFDLSGFVLENNVDVGQIHIVLQFRLNLFKIRQYLEKFKSTDVEIVFKYIVNFTSCQF